MKRSTETKKQFSLILVKEHKKTVFDKRLTLLRFHNLEMKEKKKSNWLADFRVTGV